MKIEASIAYTGFPAPSHAIVVTSLLTGLTLGVVPVSRREFVSLLAAFKIVWIGEVISIGVMELAMNAVAYGVGGAGAGSVLEPIFWIGIALAVPAGFIVAWPVNWWLLERNLKACH